MDYYVKKLGNIKHTRSSVHFCSWTGLTDHNLGENVLFNAEELDWPIFLNDYNGLSCDADLEPDYTSPIMYIGDVYKGDIVRKGGRERNHPNPKRKHTKINDRRLKQLSTGMLARERREILRADGLASWKKKPLNTCMAIHPRHLDDHPGDNHVGEWLEGFRRRLSTWLNRKSIGTYMVGARENYQGKHREHQHLIAYVPKKLHTEIYDAVRRWYPASDEELFHITPRASHGAIRYICKQMRGDQVGPPGPNRLYRETHCRYTGALVSPILGRRIYISRSLATEA